MRTHVWMCFQVGLPANCQSRVSRASLSEHSCACSPSLPTGAVSLWQAHNLSTRCALSNATRCPIKTASDTVPKTSRTCRLINSCTAPSCRLPEELIAAQFSAAERYANAQLVVWEAILFGAESIVWLLTLAHSCQVQHHVVAPVLVFELSLAA